jgi:hypothetical protein
MRPDQILIADLNAALLAITAVGLLLRKRERLCWSFFGYVCATLLGNRLVAWFPDQFYTQGFWTLKEGVYTALKVCVVFEIATLTFSVAKDSARRRVVAVLLAGTLALVAVVLLPHQSTQQAYDGLLVFLVPRAQAVLLWLFVAVALLAWHQRIPLHPFHRTIALGFGLYLSIYSWALGVLGLYVDAADSKLMAAYSFAGALDPLAFGSVVGLWAVGAWRSLRFADEVPERVRRLQPWASSW